MMFTLRRGVNIISMYPVGTGHRLFAMHTDVTKPHALVIGGGIGGLAAGIALRQAGFSVAVYERAPDHREIGAGITLWANAMHALHRLGVADALYALRPPAPSGGIYTWRGRPLLTLTAETLQRRSGAISVVVQRAELLGVLRQALGEEHILLDKRCVGVTEDRGGVLASFADGSQARGDILIGADGIRSVVRQQIVHDGEPRYAGYVSYRAITAFEHDGLHFGLYLGSGARFGITPLSDGRIYWFATRNMPATQHVTVEDEYDRLVSNFADWCAPIGAIVRATPASEILVHPIADRMPRWRWGHGRVTLLGDAAHPMTPNMGQGGCQALEDAVVLGECLAGAADPAAALRHYERRRRLRTARLVLQSRLIGDVGQWSHPALCALRNATFRVTAPLQAEVVSRTIAYRT